MPPDEPPINNPGGSDASDPDLPITPQADGPATTGGPAGVPQPDNNGDGAGDPPVVPGD